MQLTVKEIAQKIHGTVEGDENVIISRPCKIEEGCEGGITFLGNPKYTHYIYEHRSSAIIVGRDFQPEDDLNTTLIRVDNPYMAVATLLHLYNNMTRPPRGRSLRSHVGRGTKLGRGCYVGPFASIGRGCHIGNNVQIHPNVTIGDGCRIGDDTIVYAGANLYRDTIVGARCIIHSGAVLGADGFGFAPTEEGGWNKIDQIGNVVLEDDVEIGANTCIDRATMGSTIIHRGVKLDNLCQIAHNVVVGQYTAMASQAGVAGSAKVGEHCIVAGQAGIVGHITVGDHVTIGAQSGVTHSVESGATIFGSPAEDARRRRKIEVYLRNIENLVDRVKKLEQKLKS
ncbi:MAG: UDP-3-O-(3-hydroxymyristoyl)glucosamine N-acyltransferase [Bacteroidales bacterium]|nr:UDP-3-O-(3-hydroxymyristoyl)glucosamine N-acyltransferase [Bacteroidales bacterium]